MSNGASVSLSPVNVSLEELRAGSVPFSSLEKAFGPDSLGILIVRDLPAEFPELRHRLLSYSSYLANLPLETLESLESPASKWLVGWSCGKETLKDGRYDTLKGSYYVNCAPQMDDPKTQSSVAERFPSFPEYTAPNVWPPESALPGFEETFKRLCSLITGVACLVARACDQYAVSNIEGYEQGFLEKTISESLSTKARLLHYFPNPSTSSEMTEAEKDEDDWCATHLDHGSLTGLTSAMFVDEAEGLPKNSEYGSMLPPVKELDQSPDPKAGLYIHSRNGTVTKVSIPRDCLGFQTGEALEIITHGKFKAVPHFVRGTSAGVQGKVARNTLAVFTQPNLWEKVDEKRTFAQFAKEIVERNH